MKITPFQAVILAIFGVSLVGGLLVLATTKSKSAGTGVPVVIWGTLPSDDFTATISEVTAGQKGLKITYVEKRLETFDQELLEAIAGGRGPDVIVLPQDLILRHKDKLSPISYEVIPVRDFKDSFIQEGELFLNSSGVLAVPFAIDPLVMYWNRDLLSNAGISKPPVTWDEFLTLSPKLTVKDKSLNILRSAVALGEFKNIANAKDIVSAFLLQTGNTIISPVNSDNFYLSSLTSPTLSIIGAVNFYTDFANPVKPNYSWNRALPNSRDLFSAGDLAFYFGFASESEKIRNKNPNLNFDLTYFPQPKGSSVLATYGKIWGLALLRTSQNQVDAQNDITLLTSPAIIAKWSEITSLPPVRRDLLNVNPTDPYQLIFYNSALRSRGWLDPNPLLSTLVFERMIESITSGAAEASRALDTAGKDLNALLGN